MLKMDELLRPDSCLNKAGDDEPIFVLRAKDLAAPYAIRQWISARVGQAMNEWTDAQIVEAGQLANQMERWRKEHV